MIPILQTMVSEDLLEKKFVCDLKRCKGACCVEGESGAPLEKEELKILAKEYKNVKPYLTEKGIQAIEEQGVYVIDSDGDYVTPLVNEKEECAFTVFENGIAQCGIEKAYNDGKTSFRKPVSCHLYPVRITKYKNYDAVNYHKWEVCSPACKLGKELQVHVYEFLKEPLVRKYGKAWYDQLEKSAEEISR